jgi:hypothetical protein
MEACIAGPVCSEIVGLHRHDVERWLFPVLAVAADVGGNGNQE